MQTTTELFNSIISGTDYWYEVRVSVDGVNYPSTEIYDMHTTNQMFSGSPEIGMAVCGQIDLELINPNLAISRMAKIVPMIRAVNATQQSEWIKKGEYFIDTRKVVVGHDGDRLKLTGFDAMLKTAQEYTVRSQVTTLALVQDIARRAGIPVDPKTVALLNDGKMVPVIGGYTGRELLGFVGAMYGGSFFITDDGALRLLQLSETNFLISENEDYITFGGDRILV